MTYLLRTRPRKKNKALVTFVIALVVLATFRFFFPAAFSSMVIQTFAPLSKIGQTAGVIFKDSDTSRLEKEINDLRLKANDRNVLAEENMRLRELIDRRGNRNSIVGAVISKPTFTPYDTFIIDVGEAEGVRQNDMVLAGSSTAIGSVTEVYPHVSKVTAYSSPDMRHGVFIGMKNIQAEAVGQGNGNFKIVLPHGTEVNQGDSIIMPGITPIVFGTVEKIVASDQPSFINVLFKIPVNLSELYYVEIVR